VSIRSTRTVPMIFFGKIKKEPLSSYSKNLVPAPPALHTMMTTFAIRPNHIIYESDFNFNTLIDFRLFFEKNSSGPYQITTNS
jgi:hypothetical protein